MSVSIEAILNIGDHTQLSRELKSLNSDGYVLFHNSQLCSGFCAFRNLQRVCCRTNSVLLLYQFIETQGMCFFKYFVLSGFRLLYWKVNSHGHQTQQTHTPQKMLVKTFIFGLQHCMETPKEEAGQSVRVPGLFLTLLLLLSLGASGCCPCICIDLFF